ncbi:MAG: hypothetical protein NT039_01920 [Candidatus Berkelbacteria bacterium]|nr:hypothetical protein [Candidatus Berkelbacteria bacterium]
MGNHAPDVFLTVMLLVTLAWALVYAVWLYRDPAKHDPRWRAKSVLFLGIPGGLLSAIFYDIGLREHNRLAFLIPKLLMLVYLGYIIWSARQARI